MENLSNIASNRVIKSKEIKGEHVNVRYCSMSISEAYHCFPNKFEISFSTFYSYVGNEFKKPHRLTDLCEYCELGKKIKQELLRHAIDYDFIFDSIDENEYDQNILDFDLEKIEVFLTIWKLLTLYLKFQKRSIN